MKTRFFAAPAAGDLVLFRVRTEDKGVNPVHPALVLKVIEPKDGNGGVSVVIAPGTSNLNRLYLEDVDICRATHPVEFARSGLHRDTRFKMAMQLTLPYNAKWFVVPEYRQFGFTPKIGSAHPDTIKRVQKALRAWNASRLNPKNEGKVKGQSFDPRSLNK